MKLTKYAVAATLLIAYCGVQNGFADVLYMNDGTKQVGVIVKKGTDSSMVTFRATSGQLTIPRSKILRIENQNQAVSYGALGDAYLQKGDFDNAMESYKNGLQFDADNVDLKQKLQQARGGVANEDAETRADLDDKARRVAAEAMKLARGGNFDQAYNMLRGVEPSDVSPMHVAYDKSLADLYMLWGQHMLDRQNTGGATEKFRQVLELQPDNARAKALLVKTFAGDPTKLAESAEYYLQSDNPDEQLKGAEALFKLQQYEKALPVFMKYMSDSDLNGRFNITQRLQSILDTLHKQYASRGDYRKALAYFIQYLKVKPDADATPYSNYLYMIKRSETDMNDVQQRFELASFAEQVGLIPTAKEEYLNVLQLDPKSTSALTALRRFAESDLADAKEFMGQNQYVLAVQMAKKIPTEYPMYPDVIAQANQVEAKAQIEAQKLEQNKKQQARALAERGDNYYQQAQSYLAAYVSTDINIRKQVFSPRNEAAKYFGQALFAWKTALQLDPTLGDATTYNLYFKIQDASAKYAEIANRRPPSLPRRFVHN